MNDRHIESQMRRMRVENWISIVIMFLFGAAALYWTSIIVSEANKIGEIIRRLM